MLMPLVVIGCCHGAMASCNNVSLLIGYSCTLCERSPSKHVNGWQVHHDPITMYTVG